MRFIADGMLGKLTRWLRLAGKDVVYIEEQSIGEGEDENLLERAEKEYRILITSDQELHRRALKKNLESILIEETDDVAKQLVKITEKAGEKIDFEAEESLCPVCNGDLNPVKKSSISGEVPERVFQGNDRFWKCDDCDKIYWTGGHWEKIRETEKRYEQMKK